MSLHEKCLGCGDLPITPAAIFKSLVRKDTDGNYYVPLKINVCAEGDELANECGLDLTWEQLFRSLLVVDDCGHCAIKVAIDSGSLDLICTGCDERAPLQ